MIPFWGAIFFTAGLFIKTLHGHMCHCVEELNWISPSYPSLWFSLNEILTTNTAMEFCVGGL